MTKFFNVGLPRSGTTSYSKALNLRGVYDLHYPLKYLTRLRQTGQMEVYNHPTLDWRGISHAHEHAHEYTRLPDVYPGAKFVLTTRDVDSWVESFDRLIERLKPTRALGSSVLAWRFELIAGPGYQERRDKNQLREFFLAHDEAVRAFFGKNLLVLDLRDNEVDRVAQLDAWLGVTSDGAYPHLHDHNGIPSNKHAAMLQIAKNQLLQDLTSRGYTTISR